MVEADVGDHRDTAVPGVGRVEATAQPHLHQHDVRERVREVPEHDRGEQLELGRRAEASGHAVGERERGGHQAGERLRCDRPPVHDDPLPVRDQVWLGRLAHVVPGGPQGGSGQRDDAPLAVGPGDQRPTNGELGVTHRPEQRSDTSKAEADAVPAAGLDRRESRRIGEVPTLGGRRRLSKVRLHSRVSSSS